MQRTVIAQSLSEILAIVFAVAMPAFGQSSSTAEFNQVISGSNFPLTLRLKDLSSEWRRLTIGGQFEMGNWVQTFSSLFGGVGSGVYYTKGQTVKVGDETYVVAYRIPSKELDFFRAIAQGRASEKPNMAFVPVELTPQTELSLSLLNLQTAGSLNDIRSFDLNRELASQRQIKATSSTETQQPSASLSNLAELSLGLRTYAQEHNGVLPPMDNTAKLKQLLAAQGLSEGTWVDLETNESYKPNPTLSRKKLADFANPERIVAFYQPKPAADGTRGVALLDGSTKRVREAEWLQLKQASRIP